MRRCTTLIVTTVLALVACAESPTPPTTPTTSTAPTSTQAPSTAPSPAALPRPPAQPRLASSPEQLADDLVADERVLRDPSSSEAVLAEAARGQQAAYRVLGRHPEWDTVARARIPASLLDVYDRNIDARR